MDFLKIFGIAAGIFAIILVFLFLSGFYLPGRSPFDLDARGAIFSLVRSVSMRGYGLEVKRGVLYEPSETVSISDAIGSSNLSRTQIVFDCLKNGSSFDAVCDPHSANAALIFEPSYEPDKITARKSGYVAVAVCFGEESALKSNIDGTSLAGKYYVLLGTIFSAVRDQAANKCGIG